MTEVARRIVILCRDRQRAAMLLANTFGLAAPMEVPPYLTVDLGEYLGLYFLETSQIIEVQHFAFLISERQFDIIISRLRERNMPHSSRDEAICSFEVNPSYGARSIYFLEAQEYCLEIVTRSDNGLDSDI